MYLAFEIYVILICPKYPASLVNTRIVMFLKYSAGATFTSQLGIYIPGVRSSLYGLLRGFKIEVYEPLVEGV